MKKSTKSKKKVKVSSLSKKFKEKKAAEAKVLEKKDPKPAVVRQDKKKNIYGIRSRNPVVVLILSIITLGIYVIYWLASTTNDLRRRTDNAPDPWMLVLLLIPLVNIFVMIIYLWRYCRTIENLTGFKKINLFLLWLILSPVALVVSQVQLNKIAEKKATTKKQKSVEETLSSSKEAKKEEAKEKKSKKSLFGGFSKLFKKKKSTEDEEKDKVTKRPFFVRRYNSLRAYLDTAGVRLDIRTLMKRVFYVSVGIVGVLSIYYIYLILSFKAFSLTDVIIIFIFIWTVGLAAVIFAAWMTLYFALDVIIYKRKTEIEEVLPDYLQLTASNIKAGMTIDRALWYAVRPRFGVLASEIEMIAKESMKGVDLKVALTKFANKYDSGIVKRSVSLLVEGIESGGEVGTLLNKISINIQENRIMRREMAANVTTYVIFISFATIAAAPTLFALSGVLIKVISSLGSSLGTADTASSVGFFISFSGSSVSYEDFRIFAFTSLIITSLFSGAIIATIVKGNAKAGIKYIPWFIVSTIALFLLADKFLGSVVSFIL